MKEKLNILLIGSGGRESAIADKLLQSPRTAQLFTAPGNAGTAATNVQLDTADFDAVREFITDREVDMVVVGPEVPLVAGIADALTDMPVKVIGPGKDGAQLEGSKEFAKEFMFRHGIPTARFMTVTHDTLDEGFHFLDSLQPPFVLKADGLAAGKGVLILPTLTEAKENLRSMLDGMFGNASSTVVIEEFLDGRECSVFVATDGEDYKILPVAKDYKRVGEGDTGPNTGGMGAVSPVSFADAEFMEKVEKRIVIPTLAGLRAEGIDYSGFIFLGLIRVGDEPMVIEYNVRMGDPETEVVMPRIKSDLVCLLEGIADRTLALKKLEEDERACAAVMLTAGGYPGSYAKGDVISGLDRVRDAKVFHAGTSLAPDGRTLTAGGRVLAVAAYAPTVAEAAARAQQEAAEIEFDGKQFRRDIGLDV